MMRILIFYFLALLPGGLQAQESVWHSNIEQAVAISVKTKKPLLLFFTGSDWCGWCIRLQKEVFKKPEFNEWAKANVVLVELDFPKRKSLPPDLAQQNAQLQQFFSIRGYPTVWIANATQGAGSKQISFEQLGRTGYIAGGPAKWIEAADLILSQRKS